MLRARKARREEPLDPHVPDPIVCPIGGGDPEHEALDRLERLDETGALRVGRRSEPGGSLG
jgi:hypothetical protein